jgi:protein-S-isoprenylcysteine O-methyltransferase Ste14
MAPDFGNPSIIRSLEFMSIFPEKCFIIDLHPVLLRGEKMALREEMEKQGTFLFRWRSYVPLVILPVLFVALPEAGRIAQSLGDTLRDIWTSVAIAISFLGLLVRCLTIGYAPRGTSGRNTKEQIADVLNTEGMYSMVRNPLYLGNFIIALGMVLFVGIWWLVLFFVLAFWLYYERIIFTEEEYLRSKFDPHFELWAEDTPAFVPRLRNWRRPNLPFSLRTVLKREYTGFFIITASFTFLRALINLLAGVKFDMGRGWAIFFISGLVVYLSLRTLKKNTSVLEVEGR